MEYLDALPEPLLGWGLYDALMETWTMPLTLAPPPPVAPPVAPAVAPARGGEEEGVALGAPAPAAPLPPVAGSSPLAPPHVAAASPLPLEEKEEKEGGKGEQQQQQPPPPPPSPQQPPRRLSSSSSHSRSRSNFQHRSSSSSDSSSDSDPRVPRLRRLLLEGVPIAHQPLLCRLTLLLKTLAQVSGGRGAERLVDLNG
jgi:hypothetical protein